MLKRLLGALLALAMCVASVGALAEFTAVTEPAATATSGDTTIKVVDTLGAAMQGIQVTVYDSKDVTVQSFITDATGQNAVKNLAAGSYSVKAYDPADGYSCVERFTAPTDTEVTLTLRKLAKGSTITVGNVTKVNGTFFTDMWGNNTSDIDVRSMLFGYQTIAWNANLKASLDTSVVRLDSVTNGNNGNKTYTFTVSDGLTYNDGTVIDARDYVFSILLQSSPQIIANGAMAYGYTHLVGFDNYNTGKQQVFSGVRLLSNTQFSMTINGDYLPYYYELVYLNVMPYPISVIVPGCEVADTGDGAMIRPLYDENNQPLGEFTADVLKATIMDEQTGYLSHPKVTSGPYQMESYDRETGTVEFSVNPLYKGNFEGQRPLIEKVTLVVVNSADMIDKLSAGEVNVLNKITDIDAINAGIALRDENKAQITTYLRSGQAFIGLACEQGPTSYEAVRKAISHCLNQQTLTSDYTGTYGLPVYSQYGLGQWMAADYVNTMQDEVTTYAYDVAEAKKLLVKDGWKYNEKGENFDESVDTVRYRRLNQKELDAYNALTTPVVQCVKVDRYTYMPLELHFALVTGSGLCTEIEEVMIPDLESIGFRVVKEEVDFTKMLRCYYRQDARTYNFFALASNFTHVYDPYLEFSSDAQYQGTLNRSGIADKELVKLAKKLRETEPNDEATYISRWLDVMKEYSNVLPTIPIYSNMYVDMETPDVQGYEPNNMAFAPR